MDEDRVAGDIKWGRGSSVPIRVPKGWGAGPTNGPRPKDREHAVRSNAEAIPDADRALTAHEPVETLEDERARWAVRVHDRLTQSVTSALLEVQTLRRRIGEDPAAAIASLDEVEAAIRDDLRDIRELLFELQGTTSELPTLRDAIQESLERWNLGAEVRIEGDPEAIDSRTRETAEVIMTEAIANAAKHSGTAEIAIDVTANPRGGIRLQIRDHGQGGLTSTDASGQHFGLQLMRERAEDLGGTLEVENVTTGGVCVRADLPSQPTKRERGIER